MSNIEHTTDTTTGSAAREPHVYPPRRDTAASNNRRDVSSYTLIKQARCRTLTHFQQSDSPLQALGADLENGMPTDPRESASGSAWAIRIVLSIFAGALLLRLAEFIYNDVLHRGGHS
jgi:hypothetical protein